MKTRRTDNFKLGDKVVFKKYLKSFNKVWTVVGIDELEQNIAVKTRFKTYIIIIIDEIVKIEDDKIWRLTKKKKKLLQCIL